MVSCWVQVAKVPRPFILCGSSVQVPTAEAQAYATSIGASFLETSAKTKSNVDEIFLNISKALPAYTPQAQLGNSLKLNPQQKSGGGGCC